MSWNNLGMYFWILVLLSITSYGSGEGFFYEDLYDDEEFPGTAAADPFNPDAVNKCRMNGGLFLEPHDFALFTCATCYHFIDEILFYKGKKFIRAGLYLKNNFTKEMYVPDISNTSSPVWSTFAIAKGKRLWEQCCESAVSCCKTMMETPRRDGVYCPRTWDGWSCWSDTDNGTIVKSPCPRHIYFNNDPPLCTRYATKTCHSNGQWYRIGANEWSNFTTCRQKSDLEVVLNIHIITFAVSIVCLIPALVIFNYYKQLRVFRISMHKNLFMSLLLNGIFVIIFQSYFMVNHFEKGDDSVLEANQPGCKLFYTATKYFRLCTYMWMFCEGFYLHKLIAAAFTEQKSMVIFYIMGWGLPLVPVTIWAIVRLLKADDRCWTIPYGNFEWIFNCTMLLALLMNFFFLGDIVRVLVTKLRSTNTDEPTQFRRAVKATAVLIPLFGLHFSLLIYYPRKAPCGWMTFHTYATYAVDGIQGAVVSLIFCYWNNEILYLLKRSYRRRKLIMSVGSQSNGRRVTTSRASRASLSTNADSIVLPDVGHDKSCRPK